MTRICNTGSQNVSSDAMKKRFAEEIPKKKCFAKTDSETQLEVGENVFHLTQQKKTIAREVNLLSIFRVRATYN